MKLSVFGTGYVGLVHGAVLAASGNNVICVDRDADKIRRLQGGEIPFHEPGLGEVVRDAQDRGLLSFTTNASEAVKHGSVILIAVGTPALEDGSADMGPAMDVADTIGAHIDGHKIVVAKSTLPVGASAKLRLRIAKRLAERGCEDIPFDVVANPEFLREGSAVADSTQPDRIINGTDSEEAIGVLRELYAPFVRSQNDILVMDPHSAELTKYAANCMLATKISFINEIAGIAERLGADIDQIRRGIGMDLRIGHHFINPGVGFGGSCFPKDIQALIRMADDVGFNPDVLRAVDARNKTQMLTLFDKARDWFGGSLEGRVFAIWGLAFKPDTDDVRDAPSRVLMEALWSAGALVQAYDPAAMQACEAIYGHRENLTLCGTRDAALRGADALMVVTEWEEFRTPDLARLRTLLKTPVIFDGRNIYDPDTVAAHGLGYVGVGRQTRRLDQRSDAHSLSPSGSS